MSKFIIRHIGDDHRTIIASTHTLERAKYFARDYMRFYAGEIDGEMLITQGNIGNYQVDVPWPMM